MRFELDHENKEEVIRVGIVTGDTGTYVMISLNDKPALSITKNGIVRYSGDYLRGSSIAHDSDGKIAIWKDGEE
jgi:hypothetical protein